MDNASVALSTGSNRSRRSTYRRVAPSPQVDESLFGSRRSGRTAGLRQAGQRIANGEEAAEQGGKSPFIAGSRRGTSRQASRRSQPPARAAGGDAMTLSRGAIESIKQRALAPVGAGAQAAGETGNRRSSGEAAEARKARIRAMEEQRETKRPSPEVELEARRRGNPIAEGARVRLEHNHDEVRTVKEKLNKMRAKTLLDEQMREKAEREREVQEEEDLWHGIMLEQLQENAQRFEQEQARKKREAAETRKHITEQLEEREHARILEAERREQEGQMMLNAIRKDEEKAARDRERQREEKARHARELTQANDRAIRRKQRRQQMEKEDEQRIVQYIKRQEAEQRRRAAEEARRKAEKDAEFAQMLAQQEREADKQADEDEQRAIRWQEEQERKEAERERQQEAARERMMKDVLNSRARQIERKKRAERAAAEESRREAQRTKAELRAMGEQEKEDFHRRKEFGETGGAMLKSQIEEKHRAQRAEPHRKKQEREEMLHTLELERTLRDRIIREQLEKHVRAGHELPPGLRLG